MQDDPNFGAPDLDQGARLHAEKNAPWVNGTYSHLRFPPYQFRAYPRMLYHPNYGDAKAAYERAVRLPARGTEDAVRAQAMIEAQRALDECMCIVQNQDEEAARQGTWFETPRDAAEAKEQWAQAIAQAAAESAYDDRRLGAAAKAERKAADEASDGHLVEIPARRKGGWPKGRSRKD